MLRTIMSAFGLFALIMTAASITFAVEYTCPSPDQVKCIPSQSQIGDWRANGGQMTGNSFALNSQCANVIQLNPNQSRLLCCYTKCGVFIKDVPQGSCRKTDQSHFTCQ